MSKQKQIAVVARLRGGGYAVAAQRALPHALQVTGRCHLMENACQALLDAARKSMSRVRSAVGAATINPALLTSAEKLRYEGYLRREETNAAILGMSKQGVAIEEIMRRTGYSRGLIRKVLRETRQLAWHTGIELARSRWLLALATIESQEVPAQVGGWMMNISVV